jgi:hypothetical protein
MNFQKDNVGSILSISGIFVYLADLKSIEMEEKLSYLLFFLVIILQERDPWNMNYTLFPILSSVVFFLIITYSRGKLP